MLGSYLSFVKRRVREISGLPAEAASLKEYLPVTFRQKAKSEISWGAGHQKGAATTRPPMFHRHSVPDIWFLPFGMIRILVQMVFSVTLPYRLNEWFVDHTVCFRIVELRSAFPVRLHSQ